MFSDENIFLSIFLANSYIQNKELLSLSEQKELARAKRIFDIAHVEKTIEEIRARLCNILDKEDDFFQVSVYFKPKKYQNGITTFRPLHTAALIDQMAMIAMLQVLVYDFSQQGKLLPSELSRLLPANFYGNIVSYDGKQLFLPWQDQYHKYTTAANEFLAQYSETKEYRYEVNLDLENFFPSINPRVLYNLIFNMLPMCWKNDLDVKTILKKLIIFKLCNLDEDETAWYLHSEKEGDVKCCGYAKGLPQGLPHTYFLANLFMLLVQEEYEKIFPGKMVFYVDDSVIFTNGYNGNLNNSNFLELVDLLNCNIRSSEKKMLESNFHTFNAPEGYSYPDEDFGVVVHRNKKSTCSTIPDAKESSGEIYLHGLSRETSNISFDICTAFSENETHMMLSRIRSILSVISAEINRIGKENNRDSYREKLLRYQKFFKYRETILSYQDNGNIQDLYNNIVDDITLRNNPDKIKDFYEKYTDDILAAAIQFTFRRCTEECAPIDGLIKAVNNLVDSLYGEHKNHSYILKYYDIYLKGTSEYRSDDLYQDLIPKLFSRFHTLFGQKDAIRWETFGRLLQKEEAGLFDYMGYSRLYTCSKYVRANSSNLTRIILNAIYSYIFEYNLEDRFVFSKHSRNPIEYAQIRVLAALRNPQFSFDVFTARYANDYTRDEFHCAVDYSLLQVLDIFKTFVRKVEWIDQLILTHKYCSDTWRNGSKFLHFYTLHNQEHAVTLIRSSIEWLHAISYFSLKQIDYFILFVSCYLHDISMVSLPHTEKFYTGRNPKADQIYTELESQLCSNKTENKKRALYDAYKMIDEFFECDVRGNHAADSATEIRKFPELSFLDPSIREFVARVSEAHGYDTADIYSVKSVGQKSLINEKFIKIILRLSDLSDMSRYRISNVILNHNLSNLSKVSQFHWISHLITDGFHISVSHSLADKSNGSKSFLYQGAIIEKLELNVDVLMSQTTTVTSTPCKYILSSKYSQSNKSDFSSKIVITCGQEGCCSSPQCIFLCKWFTMKNEYLIKELSALKSYLSSVPDYFFTPEAVINVRTISNIDISNAAFDCLREYVGGEK